MTSPITFAMPFGFGRFPAKPPPVDAGYAIRLVFETPVKGPLPLATHLTSDSGYSSPSTTPAQGDSRSLSAYIPGA